MFLEFCVLSSQYFTFTEYPIQLFSEHKKQVVSNTFAKTKDLQRIKNNLEHKRFYFLQKKELLSFYISSWYISFCFLFFFDAFYKVLVPYVTLGYGAFFRKIVNLIFQVGFFPSYYISAVFVNIFETFYMTISCCRICSIRMPRRI